MRCLLCFMSLGGVATVVMWSCGAREDRYGNKLSPWGRESTAEPGEGTRVVDYTPQSLRDSPPTLVGQLFFAVNQLDMVYSSRPGAGRVRRSRERVRKTVSDIIIREN